MTPWLSVIVPIHGGATYLGATLKSVAAEVANAGGPQDRDGGVELRLYNSADDDGAAQAIMEQFTGQLDIVWQDVHQLKRWTAKTNLGVTEARAPHVAMLHQDDLWKPGHLAALSAARAAAPAAALSIAPSCFVGPNDQPLGDWRLPFAPGLHLGRDVARTLLVQNSIAIPSPLIARDAWMASGGLDDSLWYTADWDLYLKLARQGDVFVRTQVTTAFRVHGQSLTVIGSRDSVKFHFQLQAVLERHMPALEPLPRGIAARARAGIMMNCALAQAANGNPGALVRALWRLMTLGPVGAVRFMGESRLIDRLIPRFRLALALYGDCIICCKPRHPEPKGKPMSMIRAAVAREPVRYTGIGVVVALVNNVLLVAGDRLGIAYPALILLTWAIGGGLGYGLHVHFTFRAGATWKSFAQFMGGVAVGIPLTFALLALLVSWWKFPMSIAAPTTTVAMYAFNYANARVAILWRWQRSAPFDDEKR